MPTRLSNAIARKLRDLNWVLYLFIAGLCSQTNLTAAATATTVADSEKIDAIFAPLKDKKLPGAAVLVMRNGQVVHSKAYGMADVASGALNTTQTEFRLASITKMFTATAILRLAEQGRLSLTDPVSKYIPGFNGGDKIQIRHLLSHTAGLPDFMGFEDAIKLAPNCEPGDRLNYSNLGYVALGRIIEKVTGKSYEAHLRETIFVPLGMKNTHVTRQDSMGKSHAFGYSIDDQGTASIADFTEPGRDPSPGALSSTVEDMAIWAKALTTGKLISKALFEKAATPVQLNDGRKGVYGYGLMLVPFRGLREAGHGGDISGFNSYFAYYPEENLVVIALSNAGMRSSGPIPTAGDVAHRIVGILIPEKLGPEWPQVVPVSDAVLKSYAGRYRIDAPPMVVGVMGDSLELTCEGGHLFGSSKQGRTELFAESETTFYSKLGPVKVLFAPGSNKGVISLMGLREFPLVRQP